MFSGGRERVYWEQMGQIFHGRKELAGEKRDPEIMFKLTVIS